MKTLGVILIILGAVSAFGGIIAAANGHKPNLTGIGLIVLGFYLNHRANKKRLKIPYLIF